MYDAGIDGNDNVSPTDVRHDDDSVDNMGAAEVYDVRYGRQDSGNGCNQVGGEEVGGGSEKHETSVLIEHIDNRVSIVPKSNVSFLLFHFFIVNVMILTIVYNLFTRLMMMMKTSRNYQEIWNLILSLELHFLVCT